MWFLYLPLFFLLLPGLAYGARRSAQAGAVACLAVALLSGIDNAVFFAGFAVLPVSYVVYVALSWRGDEHPQQEWRPLLPALAYLVLALAGLFAGIALVRAWTGLGGLQIVLSQDVMDALKDVDPQIRVMMQKLAGEWSFVLFASAGWVWVLMLYGMAVLANQVLVYRQLALRPSLGLSPYGLPPELLVLLCASVIILAVSGEGHNRFVAATAFLLVLLPYFLAGLALLHTASRRWQGRKIWLALFYAILVTQGWPALPVIGAGLYAQLADLLDSTRKMG